MPVNSNDVNEGNEGKRVRLQINAAMNEEDMEIMDRLKRTYGVNVSAIVKLAIRKLLNDTEDLAPHGTNNHSRKRV